MLSHTCLVNSGGNASNRVTCPAGTLNPGQTKTCNASAAAQAGQHTNTATAQGTPPGGLAAVTATDFSYYFGASPQLTIQKETNGQDAGALPGPYIPVGNPVAWTYLVTNGGNVSLTGVSVTDNPAATISCPKTTLAPAASMVCNAAGLAVRGQHSNLGTAAATSPIGIGITNSDASYYLGVSPDLVIVDLDRPHLTPLYDPFSHLVYAARSSDVTHVMAAGRWLMRDRKLLTLDWAEIAHRLKTESRDRASCFPPSPRP